jgi:hypothetical protein
MLLDLVTCKALGLSSNLGVSPVYMARTSPLNFCKKIVIIKRASINKKITPKNTSLFCSIHSIIAGSTIKFSHIFLSKEAGKIIKIIKTGMIFGKINNCS